MVDDIVKTLRYGVPDEVEVVVLGGVAHYTLHLQAADEIERLRALISAAYEEGWWKNADDSVIYDSREWEDSEVNAALKAMCSEEN